MSINNVIHIVVEGQTELIFVNKMLKHRWSGFTVTPFLLGGNVKYSLFRRHIQSFLNRYDTALVTTMLDYQGLKSDYLGRTDSSSCISAGDKATYVEDARKADLSDSRYIPFIEMHEFEAFLFSKPEAIADEVAPTDKKTMAKRLLQIRHSKSEYTKTPEEINESAATSPSARIEALCLEMFGSKRAFQKTLHGPIIAEKIGLQTIMDECPHFKAWIDRLDTFVQSRA